jgi:cold-inducible RNA-binding protein
MTLFVANVFWETTEAEVAQLFAPYGTVERVQILRDRVTGRSRGFGFVEMPDATEAPQWGRPLTVSEARSREERRSRDDRGGPRRPR